MLPSQKLVWDVTVFAVWFVLGIGCFSVLLSLILTRNIRNPFVTEGAQLILAASGLIGLIWLLQYWGLNP